jgi:hypothetical protein
MVAPNYGGNAEVLPPAAYHISADMLCTAHHVAASVGFISGVEHSKPTTHRGTRSACIPPRAERTRCPGGSAA